MRSLRAPVRLNRIIPILSILPVIAIATFASMEGCSQSGGEGSSTASNSPGNPSLDAASDPSKTDNEQDSGGSSEGPVDEPNTIPPADAAAPSKKDASSPPPLDASTPPVSLRFVAFGDSRDHYDRHAKVVNAFAAKNPQLILDTGDIWSGYPAGKWRAITTANANIADLLNKNLYLVSRGNHETLNELLAFSPTLVRNKSEKYGFLMGNAYFISVGMNPATATTFLDNELQKPEAQHATWRFVFSHFPIYNSGDGHGIDGIPAVEALCDKHHVTVFFSGHEHIYERSHQMFGGSPVDKSDRLTASKGTVYMISGGGGAPFYGVDQPLPSSHATKTDVNHYLLIDTNGPNIHIEALDTTNTAFDKFDITQ